MPQINPLTPNPSPHDFGESGMKCRANSSEIMGRGEQNRQRSPAAHLPVKSPSTSTYSRHLHTHNNYLLTDISQLTDASQLPLPSAPYHDPPPGITKRRHQTNTKHQTPNKHPPNTKLPSPRESGPVDITLNQTFSGFAGRGVGGEGETKTT